MRAKLDPAPCPEHLIGFAERLATAAGEVVRRHFRAGLEVQDKPDATPVTLADREGAATGPRPSTSGSSIRSTAPSASSPATPCSAP
jgi:hypothetical protein